MFYSSIWKLDSKDQSQVRLVAPTLQKGSFPQEIVPMVWIRVGLKELWKKFNNHLLMAKKSRFGTTV